MNLSTTPIQPKIELVTGTNGPVVTGTDVPPNLSTEPWGCGWIIAVATFLLDHRRIRPSDEAFLCSIRVQALRAGPVFALTARQRPWWDTIIDDHYDALIEFGFEGLE